MRWVEEWGEERRIANRSKSPVEDFARSTLEKRLKIKEGKCKDCIIVFARSTLDIGEVNWRQRGHELNIEDQKEKEIRNIRKKKETWTRIWRSKDLVIFVYLWGIEDPPRNKRKGGKGRIVGKEKSFWTIKVSILTFNQYKYKQHFTFRFQTTLQQFPADRRC